MTEKNGEEKIRIAFTGTEEYRKKIHQAALDRGLKVQNLLETAVSVYLDDGAEPSAPTSHPERRDKWHRMLEAILASGNKKAITAVQSNLAVFFEYIGGEKRN